MRWGFKKKLTRETWHTIGHIIKNRDEDERVSHVYAYGTRLPSDKVKKETARYKTCDENEECCTKQVLPISIEVRSDDEEIEEKILSMEVQGTHLNNISTTWPPVELYDLESSWNSAPVLGAVQLNDHQIPGNTLLANLPTPIPIDDLSQNAKIWETGSLVSYSQPSPFNQCDDVVGYSSPGISRLRNAFFIPMSTMSLFSTLNIPLFHEFRALLKDNQPKIFASINQMRHLLPSEPNQLQKASVDLVILKQILYLLMNNFAGSDYAVLDTIFEQVRQFPVAHMEGMLEALPHPYAGALQQSILTIAIKSNIPTLVEVILRRGLDINRVTCRFDGRTFTPLGLACKFRRLEVVKVLLRAGADSNRTLNNPIEDGRPIACLLGLRYRDNGSIFPPVVCNILQQLLDHHAIITVPDLSREMFWRTEQIVDVLIHHNKIPVNPKGQLFFGGDVSKIWRHISEIAQQKKIVPIIQSILQNDSIPQNKDSVKISSMTPLLRDASYKGNLSLIKFLLEQIGLTPDSECLCKAIRGNQPLLVTKYVQMGVRIDKISSCEHDEECFVKNLPSDVDPYLLEGCSLVTYSTTPFAEAIRWGNQDMIDLLKSLGSLNTTTNKAHLKLAIFAAVETGNKNMVQELIAINKGSLVATLKPSLLGISGSTREVRLPGTLDMITPAVLGGRKDIVELLMAAGIPPDSSSIAVAVLMRNIQLVELFLDTATCIDASSGLGILAVRWGNPHVLKLLNFCATNFNTNGIYLGCLNIRSLGLNSRQSRLSRRCMGKQFSPFTEAIEKDDHVTFQLLLDNGVDCNAFRNQTNASSLAESIKRGHEAFVYKLLAHGADVNDPSALLAATQRSHKLTEAILELFNQRYPDHNGSFAIPALREAIGRRDQKMVRMLATHADVNKITYTIPQGEYAIVRGHPSLFGEGIATGIIEIVEILLESGGNPNSTVEVGGSFSGQDQLNAVLKAISTGNLAMVELLHNAGADLGFSATVGMKRTSLQLAIELGHLEIVQYLLDRGVDVNAPPCIWEGATALQFAAKIGSVHIAEILHKRGAEINHPGSRYMGATAFEIAAGHGRTDILLWLFHHGVDIVSDGGKQVRRACEFAEENGQIAAKDLVEQLGREAQQNVLLTSYQTFW